MIFRSNFDISQSFNDIVINHRHYNLFVIMITRRPQDIPTKIFESSKYIITFSLQGANTITKFNNIYKGFGDKILQLKYDKHEFLIKEIGKPPILITNFS